MPSDPKSIVFNVLSAAILDMRSGSEAHVFDEDRPAVNLLAHLIHNWPEWIAVAETQADFEQILHRMWAERDRRSDPWLGERLAFLGWSPPA